MEVPIQELISIHLLVDIFGLLELIIDMAQVTELGRLIVCTKVLKEFIVDLKLNLKLVIVFRMNLDSTRMESMALELKM